MPKKTYTVAEKADALARIQLNQGDLALTARQIGIPERTLYSWRRQWYAENQQRQTPLPPPLNPLPEFQDDLEALDFMRFQIMKELVNTANNFENLMHFASPTQRVNFLSQLLDRLIKLDEHLKPYKPVPPDRLVITWDAGLYLRTNRGYHGPFTPNELPKNWKLRYGESARLEFYWGDHTFTLLSPDEGLIQRIFDLKDFNAEPCELADPHDDGLRRRYGWRTG